jgi:hypothetical protein
MCVNIYTHRWYKTFGKLSRAHNIYLYSVYLYIQFYIAVRADIFYDGFRGAGENKNKTRRCVGVPARGGEVGGGL